MAKVFSYEDLKIYFSGSYQHSNYEETKKLAEDMCIHADGIFPMEMIERRRPHESNSVLQYRKDIWKGVTMPTVNKVFTSINKIRRSPEWSILFDPKKVPASIAHEETPEKYLMENFPFFTSITNWVFSLLVKKCGKDANAWVVTMPLPGEEIKGNQYLKPYPYIYRSDQIIEIGLDFLVVKSDDQVIYREGGESQYGDRYYVITDSTIEQWDQITVDRRFGVTWEYQHNFGYMPAFKVKADIKDSYGTDFVNVSKLYQMLPELDEALREYSDLQADIVQNIYSEKWEYASPDDECSVCNGEGSVLTPGFHRTRERCHACNGSKVMPRGPYAVNVIKPGMVGDGSNIPTPPMGYVEKTTNMVDFLDKRVNDHLWKALSAINSEFLAQVPLSQSGVAKAEDKDESNNYYHGWAEDIVAMMDMVCKFIIDYRYSQVVSNNDARYELRPKINVPEKFDIFSISMLEQDMFTAKEKKVNPVILSAIEAEYANRKFSNSPDVKNLVIITLKLDPLANIDEDDKMLMLSNKGITQEKYIISCNIGEFIQRALEEKGDAFFSMNLKDQKELIYSYAEEQVANSSMASSLKNDIIPAVPVIPAVPAPVIV